MKTVPEGFLSECRNLVRLGFPVLVTELGIVVVSFADTMMVSRAGTAELAAAAFVNNVFLIPFVMLIGFAAGITPIAGAFFSSGRFRRMGMTLRTGMRLNLFLSAAFTLIMGAGYFAIPYMGQPEEILPLIREYYLIVLIGLIPSAVFNCCQQISNGAKNTAMPMWIILGANALNILGNYLLIFGNCGFPRLGLAGAGVSTAAARICAAAAIAAVMMFSRQFAPVRKGIRLRIDRALRRKVFATSVPTMLQSGVECMLWSFGSVVCGWFTAIDLAAYQVTTTMSQIGFMTYMSFGIAVSIIVANRCGVGDIRGAERATGAGIAVNLLLAALACAIFVIGGKSLLRLFTPDEDVILTAHALLLPLVLYQIFDALQIVYSNAIRGTSRVNPLLWASLISYVAVGVPAAYILGYSMQLRSVGVYWSFAIAIFTAYICLYLWYRKIVNSLQHELNPGKVISA